MDRLSARRPAVLFLLSIITAAFSGCAAKPEVTLLRDDASGTLAVLVGGREALVFQYGAGLDLPHYWPMRSPSGKNMLVQKTEPYPHHRSFWFADTVRPEASERDASFYNALTSGAKTEAGEYGPPFRDRIRHQAFSRLAAAGGRADIEAELVWETDGRPVIDERRRLVVHSLGAGEYLLDLTWTLTASHGDIHFTSDDVHYAWPFLRLDPVFSGEKGGKITSDTGASGQEATNMKPALWVDYSNTVDGIMEGVALFQGPDGREHRWLTREYGTFGPRRPDDRSGKPFTLKAGETLSQRVGVLVHKGDVTAGRVRARYRKYIEGRWKWG